MHDAVGLEPCERAVPRVGQGASDVRPAHVVAGPVVTPERGVAHELLTGHGVARRGVGTAIVGDARVRRDARARERGEAIPVEHLERRGERGAYLARFHAARRTTTALLASAPTEHPTCVAR